MGNKGTGVSILMCSYIILNESAPQYFCYKNELHPKGKRGRAATIFSTIISISQKTGLSITPLK